MSSRQQEKERRRQERIAAEQAASARQARAQRLRIVGGAVLLVAAVAVVAVVLLGGSGGSGGDEPKRQASNTVPIPARKTTDLNAAVAASGCTLRSYPKGYEDRGHVSTSTKVRYQTNPPSFGKHFEVPASDGDYSGTKTPAAGHWVHSLEHGRIIFQYAPGTPQRTVRGLVTLWNEDPDLVMVLQNNTDMPYEVAAVAWTHVLGCKTFTPKAYDALRAFRDAYRLKAPEKIAQPE